MYIANGNITMAQVTFTNNKAVRCSYHIVRAAIARAGRRVVTVPCCSSRMCMRAHVAAVRRMARLVATPHPLRRLQMILHCAAGCVDGMRGWLGAWWRCG